MTVRTISQLPGITTKTELNNDCLFETSKKTTTTPTKYTSKKVSYGVLNDRIQEDSKSFLSTTYGIKEGMNLDTLKTQVEALYNSDVTLKGEVDFLKNPVVGTSKEPLATQEYVKKRVKEDNSGVITPTSTKLFEISGTNLVFNSGISYTQSTILQLPPNLTGNLILWGWMADNGTDMHPSKAWVALKRVSSPEDTSDGLILQVHPWILGTFRSQLQYVSFGVPVSTGSTGMFIRIDSGFEVNEENSGNQTSNNSLADSVPNKFVGYILGKES